MQKRVLLFTHDGSGLGHLSRVARIATEIQGLCASLVVTGLRQSTWIVPDECEVLCLPNWDSFRSDRIKYWDRPVWLEITIEEAMRMRRELLDAAFRAFSPDAILVDYLPFGKFNELKPILSKSKVKKYLILRGIIDTSDYQFLCGEASGIMGTVFDRILVTADRRIVDISEEYSFDPLAASKVTYVGYVSPKTVDRCEVRRARGLHVDEPWVVCSGGGGMYAEKFLQYCIDVAATMPHVQFDIVFGPRSNKTLSKRSIVPPNCRVKHECRNLSEMHASSDVVATTGGYNSIIEAAVGGARLIVFPSQGGNDDEQYVHTSRLAKYYPVCILKRDGDLRSELESALAAATAGSIRPCFPLDVSGTLKIRELVLADLGV